MNEIPILVKKQFIEELPNLPAKEREQRILEFTKLYFDSQEQFSKAQKEMLHARIPEIAFQAVKNMGQRSWPKYEEEARLFIQELKQVIVRVNAPFQFQSDQGQIGLIHDLFELVFTDSQEALNRLKTDHISAAFTGPNKKIFLKELRDFIQTCFCVMISKLTSLQNQSDIFWAESLIGYLLSFYTYLEPENGHELSIPLFQKGHWHLSPYRVQQILLTPVWMGSPMTAFGLLPVKMGPPVLLFKGSTYPTDPGFFLSILSDINPFGSVGVYPFKMGQSKLREWLTTCVKAAHGQKARVYGVSLGGALTQHAAARFPDLIEIAFAFCSPALLPWDVSFWNKKYGKTPNEMPFVHVFRNENDIVPLSGTSFGKGWNVYKICGVKKLNFLLAHIHVFIAPEKHLILRDEATFLSESFFHQFITALHLIVSIPWFIVLALVYALARIVKSLSLSFKGRPTP